jgi:ribonuclease HII
VFEYFFLSLRKMPNAAFYHNELLPQTLSLLQAEQALSEHFGNCALIGVDEAGRGPLAGPVVAAAVVLECRGNHVGLPLHLNDSKKLSEKQRESVFRELPGYCKHYAIGEASAKEIDDIGILNATFLAMRRALDPVLRAVSQPKILVDGNLYIREINKSLQMPIIKGDGRVACIAAASIFAKASRDNSMREFAKKFPEYGFEKHKGYGTKEHLAAIEKNGLCEIHRRSYAPNIRFIP